MSDVSAPVAAWVCEKLGLPTCPYESVYLLTHKDLFREFLRKNGFNCPSSQGFSTIEDAQRFLQKMKFPVMVKPTDSAGSKGVTRIDEPSQLVAAVEAAKAYSLSGRFILEEFVDSFGCQVAGDGFSVDGELVFSCFMAKQR